MATWCLTLILTRLLSAERPLQSPGEEGLTAETPSQREVSIAGETLEDMSLSSNSSLDKNDTSQEYMDDFDNLGETTLIKKKNLHLFISSFTRRLLSQTR